MFAKAARLLACFSALVLYAASPSQAQDTASSGSPMGRLPTGPAAGDMDLSPFYRWNAPLSGRPGALLREEALASQPDMPAAGDAFRILYISSDARWHSGNIPVSGMLYLPKGAPPKGGWPLVAWGHGTDESSVAGQRFHTTLCRILRSSVA